MPDHVRAGGVQSNNGLWGRAPERGGGDNREEQDDPGHALAIRKRGASAAAPVVEESRPYRGDGVKIEDSDGGTRGNSAAVLSSPGVRG
jgi:hypothetical protein